MQRKSPNHQAETSHSSPGSNPDTSKKQGGVVQAIRKSVSLARALVAMGIVGISGAVVSGPISDSMKEAKELFEAQEKMAEEIKNIAEELIICKNGACEVNSVIINRDQLSPLTQDAVDKSGTFLVPDSLTLHSQREKHFFLAGEIYHLTLNGKNSENVVLELGKPENITLNDGRNIKATSFTLRPTVTFGECRLEGFRRDGKKVNIKLKISVPGVSK